MWNSEARVRQASGYSGLLADNPAVMQLDHAVCVTGVTRVMSHHANRRPAFMKLAQQVHHRFTVA